MKMRASFRTLLIHKDGSAAIITQDARRRRNVVTGIMICEKVMHKPFNVYNAKSLSCNIARNYS